MLSTDSWTPLRLTAILWGCGAGSIVLFLRLKGGGFPSSSLEPLQLWCLPTVFSGAGSPGAGWQGQPLGDLVPFREFSTLQRREMPPALPRLQEPPLLTRSPPPTPEPWVGGRERRDMHKGRDPEIPRTKITSFSPTSTPILHPRGGTAKFQKLWND